MATAAPQARAAGQRGRTRARASTSFQLAPASGAGSPNAALDDDAAVVEATPLIKAGRSLMRRLLFTVTPKMAQVREKKNTAQKAFQAARRRPGDGGSE